MALYAGFYNQIQPHQSGVWRFCCEPSGYDIAYKKDVTSTFATQFISAPRKCVDVGTTVNENIAPPIKMDCSEKRKHNEIHVSFLAARSKCGNEIKCDIVQFSLVY